MKMTDGYLAEMRQQVVNQSIEVVRRRIDQLGTREPTIERQGEDRILIQVPGLSDPQRLIDLLGKTAKMTFQLVDETANPEQAQKGIVPIGDELLYEDNPQKGAPADPIVVEKRVHGGRRPADGRRRHLQPANRPGDRRFQVRQRGRARIRRRHAARMSTSASPSCSTTR